MLRGTILCWKMICEKYRIVFVLYWSRPRLYGKLWMDVQKNNGCCFGEMLEKEKNIGSRDIYAAALELWISAE